MGMGLLVYGKGKGNFKDQVKGAHLAHKRRKQIPLCVPRPPNCGGKEKARDSVRDDTRIAGVASRTGNLYFSG